MTPMKSFRRYEHHVRILVIGFCLLGVLGCSRSTSDEAADVDQIRIVPRRSGNAVELSAEAVYAIMNRCGFTDQQIYFQGTALRDALKNYGGACIFLDKEQAEVLLRVLGEEVQGVSQSYGYFVYDVKGERFKLGGASQSQPSGQNKAMAPR